jgi:hypothetical protein
MGIGAQVALRRSKIFPEVVYQSTLRALQNSDVTHQKVQPLANATAFDYD